MIDLRPEKMLDEVRASKAYIEHFIKGDEEVKARYHGQGYRSQSAQKDSADPENHAFEWVSLVVPQLTFGNPRVKISTSRIGAQRDVAKALQFALNRWSRESSLRTLGEKLGVDFGFRWACALTLPGYTEGVSENSDPRGWPSVIRISNKRYIFDHLSTSNEELRFQGHGTIRDKDDVIAEARSDETWDLKAIQELTEGSGVDDWRDATYQESYPARKEIAYWDIWIPEVNGKNVHLLKEKYGIDPPKGAYVKGKHHGIWVTLGAGTGNEPNPKSAYIRQARWFWGPRSGPYTWIGCYTVPDESAPLAPIPAVAMQAGELNDHSRAVSRAMGVHKKGIMVNASMPNLEEKVREFKDHYVVGIQGVENLRDHVQELELGGATDLHLTHTALLRDRLDRNSGINEIARGNIGSNATATEVASADESANIRFEFMVHKFRDGIQNILDKVGWYLYHDDKIHFALGTEAAGQFMEVDEFTGESNPIEEAWFHGGDYDSDSGATYDDLELVIEPYSMERTSEALQQRRMAELDATMANIVPLMAQFPFVDWQKYLEMRGEFMNVPNLGELIDAKGAKGMAEANAQMQLESEGGSSTPQARIGRDTGRLPQKTPGMDRGRMGGVMSGVDIGSGGVRQEGLTSNGVAG